MWVKISQDWNTFIFTFINVSHVRFSFTVISLFKTVDTTNNILHAINTMWPVNRLTNSVLYMLKQDYSTRTIEQNKQQKQISVATTDKKNYSKFFFPAFIVVLGSFSVKERTSYSLFAYYMHKTTMLSAILYYFWTCSLTVKEVWEQGAEGNAGI